MAARTGQLDEISQAIGRLSGQVESLDRYTHDREHSINNLAQKVDGLSAQITREVARMKAELQVQLDAMDRRIATLEAVSNQNTGAKNLATWFLQSPLIGWLVAAALFIAAWWKDQIR
jgi:predicted RNase H-like nuclease (RuvC/YqgF family)